MTISAYKLKKLKCLLYYCCCSVTQSCLTLCDPMDCSMPGFPVLHYVLGFSPLNRWCHPTISSSVAPFSSCPQSFPASGSFPVSQLFASGGQSTGVSVSTSSFHPVSFFRADCKLTWVLWLITPLPSFYESRTLLFDSLKQSLGQSKCSIYSSCERHKQFPKNKILLYYWANDIWHRLL